MGLDFVSNTWAIFLDMAPWLLLGLLAAGLVKAWIPDERLNRWLGGEGVWPVTKAAVIGAPLPLCSCSVLPAAMGLRRGGASRGATVSFLISTPETGVDSLAVTYAMMGPFMAVVRPIAAIVSAIGAGLLVRGRDNGPAAEEVASPAACNGCDAGSCAPKPAPADLSFFHRTLHGIRYALTDILDDIVFWVTIGIVAAGVSATLLPPDALVEWSRGWWAMPVMLLAGIPLYICATASTPLAAGLMAAGLSPGAALVLMLSGPATNLGTLALVKKELGGRALIGYLVGIAGGSLLFGFLVDMLAPGMGGGSFSIGDAGETAPAWLAWASAFLLLFFAIKPLRRPLGF